MATEIEKKYRLTDEQRAHVERRLREVGATPHGEEFETNTLYTGHGIDPQRIVLRLRRTNRKATLTYKERFDSPTAIKHQREEETVVENPVALAAILEALGYTPALVYEKRRTTWKLNDAEIVIDELPFGWFMEIEADEEAIVETENLLDVADVAHEDATYPELTMRYGQEHGTMINAQFAQKQ